MAYDKDKIDDMVLALLNLTMVQDKGGPRAWNSHDWDAMDRLYAKGYIGDPKTRAKSVTVTEDGLRRSRELCEKYFGQQGQQTA